jgi:hypothetical protein
MHGHPVQGIKGAKAPKPENGKSRLSSRPGARIAELSEEYIELRNRTQQAKAEAAEIALAEKKGTLISLRLARLQLSYLLTVHRQRMLAAPAAWGRGASGYRTSTRRRRSCGRWRWRFSRIYKICRRG